MRIQLKLKRIIMNFLKIINFMIELKKINQRKMIKVKNMINLNIILTHITHQKNI